MSAGDTPALEVRELTKQYGGLRPLRLRSLVVHAGTAVALAGLDAAAAEVLINLLTGATLPDTGEVRVFGRPTSDITDPDDWLKTVDRFGIVSERAVLLGELTAAQNLAMTLTLDVDPIPGEIRPAVESIARDAGLDPAKLDRQVATLDAAAKMRLRLARAIALGPTLLLLEHPTASLTGDSVTGFANVVGALARDKAMAVLALTADDGFAAALTGESFRWRPADGSLERSSTGAWGRVRRLFGA